MSLQGVGSGLDVKSLVEALVNAEITPVQTQHDKKVGNIKTELSAVGQLKSSLSSLQDSLKSLSDINKFYAKKITLSDNSYFTATPKSETDIAKGVYQIEVKNLAQQQSLATGYFANNATSIGSSGNMTINFGTYSTDNTSFTTNHDMPPVTINVSPDNNSISAVRDAINNSGTGVSATIIQDGQGSRIILSSSKTGANYAMQISGDISALNYDPTTGNTSLTQTISAQDSTVIVNGLSVNQSTNQLKDVIDGITLNLTKAEQNKTITLTVDDNKDQLTNLVNDFVKKYNDTITLLTNLTGYNAEAKTRGVYQGDPQFRNLKIALTRLATNPVANSNSPVQALADLGIRTNKQGLLEINKDKFSKALSDNYNDIGAIFAKTATASDSKMHVKSLDSRAKAGVYEVNLSEYTPGVSMSGTIGSYNITSGDGITLHGSGELTSLTVDVLSGSAGPRGKITIKDGIAELIGQLVDSYVNNKGELNQRNDQLNKQTKSLELEQNHIDTRKAHLESRYLKQFTSLDLMITNMQNVSTSLTNLMNTLPNMKAK